MKIVLIKTANALLLSEGLLYVRKASFIQGHIRDAEKQLRKLEQSERLEHHQTKKYQIRITVKRLAVLRKRLAAL